MPELPFTARGVTDVLNAQDRLRIGAQALKDLYKQQNLEMAGAAREAKSAIASTLTESEKIEKKIAAIRAAMSKGVGDPAKNTEALGRLQKRLDEIRGSADGAGKSIGKAFGSELLSTVTRWVGPTAAVAGAFKLITDEMRSQLALIDKAADQKMSVSASRNVVLRNLPGADNATRQSVLAENQSLASELGIDEKAINLARAEALSSSGGDRAASLAAVRGASRFLFDRPGDIGGFAGSLLDLSKVTGVNDADVNLGLLTQVAGLSRVSNPQRQAANIPRALIGARGFGFNTAEAAGLYAALTEFSGDITGESSGTAAVTLVRQLRDFNAGGLEGLSSGEKLRRLQGDETLRQEFLSNFSAETLKLAPLEQLFDPSSPVAKRFAENVSKIGDNAALAAEGRAAVSGLDVNRLNRQARFESGLAATSQQLALRDPNDNLTAGARENLLEILQRTGQSRTGALGRSLIGRLKDDSVGLSVDEAAQLIKPVIKDLEDGQRGVYVSGGYGAGGFIPGRAASPEELEQAKLLRDMVALLGEQLAEQKKGNEQGAAVPTR